MFLKWLLTVYLIAGLLVAVSLCGAGIYAAITGRSDYGGEDRISVLGFFSISSRGGALGLIFCGIALFALPLILLFRIVSH
jgi:hypothetical protein